MPQYAFTRTLSMTQAVNTFSNTTGEAGAGPTDVTVPPGVSKLTRIIIALAASVVAVASTGGNILLRLVGNGLVDGQQDFSGPGFREDTTSTGGLKVTQPYEIDGLSLGVKPGGSIQPALAITGVDPGTPEASVTLIFE